MAVSYHESGRVGQKLRTRDALIAGARSLLAAGTTPTVEAAAGAAGISRATAYRYFPTLRLLLAAAYPHIGQQSLLGDSPPSDPAERLALVVADHTRRILRFEPEMRAVLRLSLEGAAPDLPMNRGLRIGWIEDALAPLAEAMPANELRRLVLGIGSVIGIEAFVWLTDIAGLSREEAAAVMCANATALLRGALSG
jgi:AcrR family transcriptional regulator